MISALWDGAMGSSRGVVIIRQGWVVFVRVGCAWWESDDPTRLTECVSFWFAPQNERKKRGVEEIQVRNLYPPRTGKLWGYWRQQ
jgi:hypothetical protein